MKLSFLTRMFQKPLEINLEFELDLDESERHVISVYKKYDGTRSLVRNPDEFWSYGKTFELDGVRCSLSFKAVESLHTLRALNPEIRDDGAIVIDFLPPVLEYLRKRRDVKETESSSELVVSKDPLEPFATVDYDPSEGAQITAGFKRDSDDEIISKSNLKLTRDGGYARFGNMFYPLKGTASEKVTTWLEKGNSMISLADVPEFFMRDLVLIKSELSAVLADRAQRVRVITTALKPRITVQKNEPGWLDFVVDYEAGGFVVPENVVNQARIDGRSHVQYDEYKFIELDQNVVDNIDKEIQNLGAIPLADRYRVPITKFSSLEEFIDRIGGVRVLSEEYEQFLAQLTGFQPDENFTLSDSAERDLRNAGFKLRPYQRAGIHWLNWLRENHLHGILADDMGLGKTVQTISMLNIAHEEQDVDRPSLIICPKSVVPFWVREVRRCVPKIQIFAYGGPRRDKTIWNRAGECWFVSTYETVARDIDAISKVPFYFLVLDEATKIKNPNAQRTQAIKSINAMHRLALSGTPVENRLSELWSLFDFLIKGFLGTSASFASRYGRPIDTGDKQAAVELSKRIRPFLLRRLKENVAKDLPEKIEIEEWCDLTEEQRSLYGQIQDQEANPLRQEIASGARVNYRMNILPILTKLKQVCDHPALITGNTSPLYGRSEKFDETIERIKSIRDAGEQAVVFTHFLKALDLFELAFRNLGISNIRIDGSVENRQELIDRFNTGKVNVALCSIKAAGVGITLTAANHVIHFDRWWNPAVEDQATDRVHRIGQRKNVYIYRTLVSGTLEEKIAMLLERKRDLADRIIGAAINQPMNWTKEELLELLKPLD